MYRLGTYNALRYLASPFLKVSVVRKWSIILMMLAPFA